MSAVHAAHRFAAFRHVGYRRYFFSRLLAYFAVQIMSVAVGWQIYDLTRDPLSLGLIGLFQFLPSLFLILVTGSVADRYNRRAIMGICMLVSTLCGAALLLLTVTGLFSPWPVYAILVVFGIERAFLGPASQSLAPNLVPAEDLSNAIAWNSTSWQTAMIVGPVAGGLLYGLGPTVPYAVSLGFFAAGALMVFAVPKPEQRTPPSAETWKTITAGFRYIKAEKIVLGAISLDLFAVLLGGAVALMPVFARDVLTLGPWGLGLLRAAPGIGAVAMAVWLAAHPHPKSSRPLHVCRRCSLRHRNGRFRSVGDAVDLDCRAHRHGRFRHDFGLCARNSDHALDAGRAARPGERRQHGVCRRVQRTRRIPRRHDGIRFRRNLRRRLRWSGDVVGGTSLGGGLSAIAPDRHAGCAGGAAGRMSFDIHGWLERYGGGIFPSPRKRGKVAAAG
ncbi:MFS family permease [Sinorhizobium medicae]